jgi:hypothetical protein
MAASMAAIICSHKFFLGYDKKDYGRELTFYILVTILVGALGIALIALRGPSGDYDDSSVFKTLRDVSETVCRGRASGWSESKAYRALAVCYDGHCHEGIWPARDC